MAVVERLQRVADPGAARPVGRGGGGALDRALGVARGAARGSPGSGGWRTRTPRRSAPAARRAGQELEVGAGVGLHRARDVAQQHDPPADGPAAAAGEPDRVAGRPEARRATCGACRFAPPWRSRSVSPRPRGGRRHANARHQVVDLRELAGLERVEALGRAAPPRRWPGRGTRGVVASSLGRTRRGRSGPGGAARRGVPSAVCAAVVVGRSPGRCRDVIWRLASRRRHQRSAPDPNTRENTASKTGTCAGSGHEHPARRPVEPPPRDRLARVASAWANQAARSGGDRARRRRAGAGRSAPASRGQVEPERLDTEGQRQSPPRSPAARARARADARPGPRRT